MGVSDPNTVKAEFTDQYHAPTPHAYLRSMLATDYVIGEAARPYFAAAVELLQERNSEVMPVQLLDVGSSYGVGTALVKYGCSFAELAEFFAHRAPEEYRRCVESTRLWLTATPPQLDVRVVGLDVSEPALRFAQDARMMAAGITTDLEQHDPTEEDAAWLRGCNLMVSCGAFGYVTERSLRRILPELGLDHPAEFGPLAVFSLLRMFDPAPLRAAFEAEDWRFGPIEGVQLPQRSFTTPEEQEGVLKHVRARGLDPEGLETTGTMFADLYVAAPPSAFDALRKQMQQVRVDQLNATAAR